uniref:Uncharacterized protein n=1 Tax=Candidatus Kentrum sp. MB TaxID=2138164 RepID=A0A450Y2K0_9GAMM|nr:MAG: hypothetical protein BECKMB1821I_GA0114274_114310 [Candidatus Kentron sp. MB]
MKKFLSTVFLAASLFSTTAYAGSCYVTVTWPSGKPHSGVRLVGSVSWGGMTKAVHTDRQGQATITWSSNNSLSNVYVDGKERSGCKNGGSVHFVED